MALLLPAACHARSMSIDCLVACLPACLARRLSCPFCKAAALGCRSGLVSQHHQANHAPHSSLPHYFLVCLAKVGRS